MPDGSVSAPSGGGPIGRGTRARGFLGPAGRYFAGRLAQAAVVMLVVVLINFVLLNAVPGDLVDVMAGQANMDADQMAALRERYGLDRSLPAQLGAYLLNLLRLDLGYSPWLALPVTEVIASRLPVTLLVVSLSMMLSLAIGTILGVVAGQLRGSVADTAISVVVLVFYATPMFLSGLLLILVFSVQLQILPIAGLLTPALDGGFWTIVIDAVRHLVLPVTALSLFYIALYARMARATMIEVFGQDYIRTARAKGLRQPRIVFLHALRNAALPLLTMAGLQVSSMLGGAVLVETVFGLNGLGRTAFEAVLQRDVTLLLGILLVTSFVVVVANLIVDLLYLWLDPRISLS